MSLRAALWLIKEKVDFFQELEHAERERDFHSELAAQMEAEIARMTVKHRKKLGQMENNFLRLKHNLRRKYEEDRWHMEQSHMYARHQKASCCVPVCF